MKENKNNMKNNNNKIIPVISYMDASRDKSLILCENKRKSGIYRWTNNINNKSYIGSAKFLDNRLSIYYSSTTLKKRLERGSSAIYSALLKYGYNKFKLEILEYCEVDVLISREQYYLDILKPEYNICKIAGSTLGKVHSKSTKEKIGKSIKGKNHPWFGKHHTFETREKINTKHLNRIHIMPKMKLETKLKLSLRSIGLNIKV
jgi:group I intron endonuclease